MCVCVCVCVWARAQSTIAKRRCSMSCVPVCVPVCLCVCVPVYLTPLERRSKKMEDRLSLKIREGFFVSNRTHAFASLSFCCGCSHMHACKQAPVMRSSHTHQYNCCLPFALRHRRERNVPDVCHLREPLFIISHFFFASLSVTHTDTHTHTHTHTCFSVILLSFLLSLSFSLSIDLLPLWCSGPSRRPRRPSPPPPPPSSHPRSRKRTRASGTRLARSRRPAAPPLRRTASARSWACTPARPTPPTPRS